MARAARQEVVLRGLTATMRRGLTLLSLTVLAIALPVGVASAHSGEESHVYLQLFDETIEGRVEYPIGDFNDLFVADVPDDPDEAALVVEPLLAEVQEYTSKHLAIGDGEVEWPSTFQGFEILETGNGIYLLFPFVVDVEFAEGVPREFSVRYDAIIESKPDRSAFLIIENDWRSGTFRNEGVPLLTFTSDRTSQVVSLEEPSIWAGFVAVVGLGIEHIQIGSDHILFILALVLPAVVLYSAGRGWRPAPSFGSSLWRLVKIATSFTLAHSITLTLGGLGIVDVSPAIVEPIIALSIGLAAAHNLRPVFFNKEWLIAFGFGLFHGFGFAGLLGDLGLDRSNRLLSLIAFNLGIEVGQVAVILLLFPALFILRRVKAYVPLMKALSGILVLIALAWLVDRVTGLDVGVDSVVGFFIAWPRPLWIAGSLTLLAIGYQRLEASAGRLLPVRDAGGPGSEKETVSV